MVDTSKKAPIARNIAEFSPMTPNKGIAVRFNTNMKGATNSFDILKSSALLSPKGT
jgi:hypothetical protein